MAPFHDRNQCDFHVPIESNSGQLDYPPLSEPDFDHPTSFASLFRDVRQTQLSLWTFTGSALLTYFWRKSFRFRSLPLAWAALAATTFVSIILLWVVVGAHVFHKFHWLDITRHQRTRHRSPAPVKHRRRETKAAKYWRKTISSQRSRAVSSGRN